MSSSAGETACQSLASSVCSAVRVEPVALPTALTSFTSAAYSADASAGGGPGRNCEWLVIAKGVMTGTLGKTAFALAAAGYEKFRVYLARPEPPVQGVLNLG